MISIDNPPVTNPVLVRSRSIDAIVLRSLASPKLPRNYIVVCRDSEGYLVKMNIFDWIKSGRMNFNLVKEC